MWEVGGSGVIGHDGGSGRAVGTRWLGSGVGVEEGGEGASGVLRCGPGRLWVTSLSPSVPVTSEDPSETSSVSGGPSGEVGIPWGGRSGP